MKFLATADTDVGISKSTNQDSAMIKHAVFENKEVLMAVICDGMGGLAKGELASATVIRKFSDWFDEELLQELRSIDFNVTGAKWSRMLKDINNYILSYSKQNRISAMGTTFTGMLFYENQYLIVHVGDSRAYHIKDKITQLTTDQTFVAREIARGAMTPEQAKTDKRRNLLLQCVGASDVVEPDVIVGKTVPGTYMLCSDGFRHEITPDELYKAFNPDILTSKEEMHKNAVRLIDLNKNRNERDNITVIVIKALDEEF